MKKTFKRLGAMFLAMVMAVSVLCTGAFADDGATSYTIKINNSSEGHTYEAYQVFTGTLSTKTAANKDTQTKAEYTLSDIVWGSAVKGDNDGATFLTQLKADSTLSSIFDVDTCKTAADVANILSTDKTANLAENFATFVGKYVKSNNIEAIATSTEQKTPYTLSVTQAGYYFIKDKDDSLKNTEGKAYTRYILEVVGDQEVNSKDSVPTLDKEIVSGDNDVKANTAGIGDTVNYKLTSKVPDMTGYSSYTYKITDTMSAGLSFNTESVKITIDGTQLSTDDYTVSTTNVAPATFTITFNSFYEKNKDKVGKDIVVTYSATLNEKANLDFSKKDGGNTNSANLTYSNNPNGKGEGKTTDSTVYTYTTGLKLVKVDGTNTTKPLAGAEFTITGTANKHVGVSYVRDDKNGTYYKLTDGTYSTTAPKDADTDIPKYTKVNVTTNEDKTFTATATVGEDGTWEIRGLDAGEYTIKEIKAPDGYNKLDSDIKIKITGSATAENGCTWTVKKTKPDPEQTLNVVGNDHLFELTVENRSGNLPSTGGMGTKLFYTIGGLLMAGAAIVLVIKKRRSSAE